MFIQQETRKVETRFQSLDLFSMLEEMRKSGCTEAVMELSSHGIDQKRIAHLELDCAVFTNLSQDHLDYHKSMENYFEVKSRLFKDPDCATIKKAIINTDDHYGIQLAQEIPQGVDLISFGRNPSAEIQISNVCLRWLRCLTIRYRINLTQMRIASNFE